MILKRLIIILLLVNNSVQALPYKIKGRVQIAQLIENQNSSEVYLQFKRLWQTSDKYSFDASVKASSIFDNKNKLGRRIYKLELGFNF